jgi:hypothetical protein
VGKENVAEQTAAAAAIHAGLKLSCRSIKVQAPGKNGNITFEGSTEAAHFFAFSGARP